MRKSFLTLTVLLVAALPALADIGTIQLSLSSGLDNGTTDLDTRVGVLAFKTIPTTLAVTVKFSATTSGQDGGNSGVYAFFAGLSGSALTGVVQKAMVQNATFKNDMGLVNQTNPPGTTTTIGNPPGTGSTASGPRGLGFNGLVDLGSLTPAGGVWGFGASQVTTPGSEDFGNKDAQYAGHPVGSHTSVATNARLNVPVPLMAGNEAYASALGSVTAFTGTLNLNTAAIQAVADAGGIAVISLAGQGSLWVAGGGATQSANTLGSRLVIVPEPATLLFLAPIGLLMLRRRR